MHSSNYTGIVSGKNAPKSYTSGLYYKPMTIINDDSRVVNKLKASLTDDARVVIYDHHMFVVQATGTNVINLSTVESYQICVIS